MQKSISDHGHYWKTFSVIACCRLNDNLLIQIVFSEEGKFDIETERRGMDGNKAVTQVRSHVIKWPEMRKQTKLMIHQIGHSPGRLLYMEARSGLNSII